MRAHTLTYTVILKTKFSSKACLDYKTSMGITVRLSVNTKREQRGGDMGESRTAAPCAPS